MSQFERLLVPSCTESPTCQCGEETDLRLSRCFPKGSDAPVRVIPMQGMSVKCV